MQMTNAEQYKLVLDQQTAYFENLLVAVGIITTVLLIVITLFNVFVAREVLKSDVRRMISKYQAKERDDIEDQFSRLSKRSDMAVRLAGARFYITSIIPGKQFHALRQYLETLSIAVEICDEVTVIIVLNELIDKVNPDATEEHQSPKYARRLKDAAMLSKAECTRYRSVLEQMNVSGTVADLKQQVDRLIQACVSETDSA